ncbi:DUF971 domain-containing protein [candidate division KSB1 bacterium]|nr:DUF971 domain-containing protein [candidate division KSB1 bacterium]
MATEPIPVDFKVTPENELEIKWSDELITRYGFQFLRGSCPCAECVSEDTGQRMVFPEDISPNIRPVEAKPVGRYAYQIFWSDGHNSGLFSYKYLRELGKP